jgi:deoxyadenosine/deoxycytidine kinase
MITPQICCVDGNIGAGKSTVLNKLKDEGYLVFEEDLSNWGGLLDRFYQDPKRWMCTLQIKIFASMRSQYDRMRAHKSKTNDLRSNYIFVERSPISSMIFVENGVNNGFLTKDEQLLIHDIYDHLVWKPDITFYINTDVDTCFERMRARNRACERDVDKTYLQFLHEGYIKTYTRQDMRDSSHIIDGLPPTDKVVRQILNKLTHS